MAVPGRSNEYVADSNSAVELKLIREFDDIKNKDCSFQPAMSHQIFGPAETIYGYIDLRIQLYFSAARLNPYLNISYSDRVNPKRSIDVEADDIFEILTKHLMIPFNNNLDDFARSLADEAKFKPMGVLKHSFRVATDDGDRCFCVYKCETSTPGLIAYHKKLQTFILWFIDGASFIDVDDDKWQFFLLFEKYKQNGEEMYAIAGFATVYEYYAYPEHIRPRLSQILVLPPFQRQGLGAELLLSIYNYYRSDPRVKDITVEDPSEELQWVRDYVDCHLFNESPEIRDNKHVLLGQVENVAQRLKINKKQARRVYEILRLKGIDRNNEKDYREFRLEVKKRLNLPHQHELIKVKRVEQFVSKNFAADLKDTLLMNEQLRFSTLDKSYRELEEQYTRVIQRLEQD